MATLRSLAELVGGELKLDHPQQADLELTAILPLEWASNDAISFFANPKYLEAAKSCSAGALVAKAPFEGAPCPLLLHPDPYLVAAKLARYFSPRKRREPQRHPSAVIAPSARVGKAYVGPNVVIDDGADIADGAELVANIYVGRDVTIGKDSLIQPGVTILDGCQIGDRAVVNSGAIIGGDGFGFAEDTSAPDGQRRVKIPQLGNVVIGDDVEVGANTTIDRGTFGSTVIGDGSKIDNLVMLAHNTQLGTDCVIVAQAGIAGSTKLGKRVLVGGQAGFVGHIKIGDDAKIAAQSGVHHNIEAGQTVIGSPALAWKTYTRQLAAQQRLPEIHKRVFGIRTKEKS